MIINYYVLDKTLKGIRGVRLDNRKTFRATSPKTKYFERNFCPSIKIINIYLHIYNIYKRYKKSKLF